MPNPYTNLKVLLVGAFRDLCVAIHYELLKTMGYDVEFYEKGCLGSGQNCGEIGKI